MKSSGCAPGEGGDAGFGAGADLHGRFRLTLLGIARGAEVDARGVAQTGTGTLVMTGMVIRPSDVEAL